MEKLETTTIKDQKMAIDSVSQLLAISTKVMETDDMGIKLNIEGSEEKVTIPKKAISLLVTILSHMADGKSITVIPSASEISTQHAADILNVSRPHLVKLLEKGEIPFRKVGSHRRVLLQDLVEYNTKIAKTREEQLKQLVEQAQQLNMGYE